MPRFDSIILASASPRRSELLDQMGVRYQVITHTIDETVNPGEAAEDYVCRLALAKAHSVAALHDKASAVPVLGADTIVVAGTKILGKPVDREDGLQMLQLLSARTHLVYSAVALCLHNEHAVRMSMTRVSFRALSPAECERYWQTGEPLGKAGAYAVQGYAAMFVTAIAGSYTGVVGLPVYETAQLLEHFDVRTGLSEKQTCM